MRRILSAALFVLFLHWSTAKLIDTQSETKRNGVDGDRTNKDASGIAIDAFSKIEAEDAANWTNVCIGCDPDGTCVVACLTSESILMYVDVDFGQDSVATQVLFYLSSEFDASNSPQIQLRLDNVTSDPFGTLDVIATGSWGVFDAFLADLSESPNDVHDLFLTFTNGDGSDFAQIDWFEFY